MPATGIRCIMTVQDDIYGFTEAHVNTSTNFTQVKDLFIALFKARMALCGPPAKPYRGRMSLVGARRRVQKLTSVDIASINTTPTFQQVQGPDGALGPNASDQPKSSVLLRAVSSTGTEKSIFLAGVPDPVIGEVPAGPRVTFIPGYNTIFQAYRTRLITDGWGYVARDDNPANTKPQTVLGYVIDNVTNFTQVYFTGVAANYPVGTTVFIRGVKMTNRAYASPEGEWVVAAAVDNANPAGSVLITLRNSEGIQTGQIENLGTIEYVLFTTLNYADVYPESQTTRKRGNRILVGPGRRTIRPKIYL